jgi:CHAT domain-containing protein
LANSEALLTSHLETGAEPDGDPILAMGEAMKAMRQKAKADWEATVSTLNGSATQDEQSPPQAFALPKDTAAVSVCVTEFGAAAIILLPTGEAKGVDITGFTSAELHELLLRDRENTDHPRGWMVDVQNALDISPDQRRATETIETTLSALRPLLEPILGQLPGEVTTLYLLLDGKLALLPLHAAPLGDGAERLFDRFAIAYAPSMTALAYSLNDSKPDALKLYAYANPGRDLTFAEAEARAIARQFPGTVVHDPQATKLEILKQAQQNQIVHFACHAKFDAHMVDYLELRGDKLTLADIRNNLNLGDCRLVTLSACQTSVIDASSWDEFIGLPAAFLVAGASCVIGSLWEVSDISTAMLMQRFYRQFKQDPSNIARALHAAQKWVSEARAPAIAAFAAECAVTAGAEWKGSLESETRRWENAARRDPDAQPFAHPYFGPHSPSREHETAPH